MALPWSKGGQSNEHSTPLLGGLPDLRTKFSWQHLYKYCTVVVSVSTFALKRQIKGSKEWKSHVLIMGPAQLGETSIRTLAQASFADELTGSYTYVKGTCEILRPLKKLGGAPLQDVSFQILDPFCFLEGTWKQEPKPLAWLTKWWYKELTLCPSSRTR